MKQRVICIQPETLETSLRQALKELEAQADVYQIVAGPEAPEVGDLVVEENRVWVHTDQGKLTLDLSTKGLGLAHQSRKAALSPFAKALKLHQGKQHAIWDLSAGLAQDLLLMRHFGAQNLLAFERHPTVYGLLCLSLDFQRLKIPLILGSLEARAPELERPEVIYYDPMFPEKRKKSALSKKGMEFFKRWVGDDADASDVLEQALKIATERVVVKRPPYAPALLAGVNFSYESKNIRYDIYLTRP